MKKSALIVIALIAVVAIGAIFLKQKPSENTPASQNNIPSDWIKYQNTSYGFSFYHPANLEVTRHMLGNGKSVDGFLLYGEDIEQSIWIYKTSCDQECFQQEVIDWIPKNWLSGKEVTINTIQGYELNLDGIPDGKGAVIREVYLPSADDTVVYFEFPNLESQDDPLPEPQKQILYSFSFN